MAGFDKEAQRMWKEQLSRMSLAALELMRSNRHQWLPAGSTTCGQHARPVASRCPKCRVDLQEKADKELQLVMLTREMKKRMMERDAARRKIRISRRLA